MKTKTNLLIALTLVMTAWGCRKEVVTTNLDESLSDILAEAASGKGLSYFKLPASDHFQSIPQDPKNPLTKEKVLLGKLLFHETALAVNPRIEGGSNTYSCASCHHAGGGFQANVQQGIGEGGIGYGNTGEERHANPLYVSDSLDLQPLRTPSAMNGAWQELMLWNGQFGATGANASTQSQWTPGTPKETNTLGYQGLEIQAIAGLKVHRMDVDTQLLFKYGYQELFDMAFPDIPASKRYTREMAGLSIAAYERTIISNQAPFQKWLDGDHDAMTEDEKLGAVLFFGKANCVNCHTGPALSSMEFHALGMNDMLAGQPVIKDAAEAENANKGRGGFTGNASENYQFKVPQLYNLSNSAFYGHGGTFTSLKDVVIYKNTAVAENSKVPTSQLSSEFNPLELSSEEVDQLTSFMMYALNDPNLNRYEPDHVMSGQCVPNNDVVSQISRGCK
ncbi:cytochrome-c peroxidase [bacterium SCSIO 12741]|nr:cytochrome-c peroxidase [bacterium SCSIO 12741]